jgi:hypothetical protein
MNHIGYRPDARPRSNTEQERPCSLFQSASHEGRPMHLICLRRSSILDI